MADATYQPKVYRKSDELTVASGGQINVEPGGKIVANGTQAAAIVTFATDGFTATTAAKLNALKAALEGVGILTATA